MRYAQGLKFVFSADDLNMDDSLTYIIDDKKAEMNLNQISGLLSWFPLKENMGINKFNVKESEIINHISTDNYNKLIEFESRRCWDMFNNGVQLVNHLKGYKKIPISLFISSGRKLLRKIHEINYETLQSRPVITKSEKSILTFKTITMYLFGLNLAKKKTYLE